MTPEVRIRRLRPDEVELFRDVRLRALADAPDSFGERHADAAARDEQGWRDLAALHVPPGPHVCFLAEGDAGACGMVVGIADRAAPDAARVGGMWVSPDARGRGVGAALLRAVLAWAREQGRHRVGLCAPAHEAPALALYERAGFRRASEPKLHRPGMWIVDMAVVLPVGR